MEQQANKFISVAYKLYIDKDGQRHMEEEATTDLPFSFISGFGIALPAFENQLKDLAVGQDFAFTLTKDEAYGEHYEERVIELDKSIFCIQGHFDAVNIYPDAIVPLMNEEGQRFLARVVTIGDDKVKMDCNHPLAGKDLTFEGSIVENREATNDEIQQLINSFSGGGCGGCGGGGCKGGCGNCGDGGCKDGGCKDGDCDCKK